jgi:hypothetical protein
MASLREPALMTRADTALVLNVALTPSQVATMESPLLASATLIVLASPAVPVTVSTPPERLGVTLNISLDSRASRPWKYFAGLIHRPLGLPRDGFLSREKCFANKVWNLPVRLTRPIISPFYREKKTWIPGVAVALPDPSPEQLIPK